MTFVGSGHFEKSNPDSVKPRIYIFTCASLDGVWGPACARPLSKNCRAGEYFEAAVGTGEYLAGGVGTGEYLAGGVGAGEYLEGGRGERGAEPADFLI